MAVQHNRMETALGSPDSVWAARRRLPDAVYVVLAYATLLILAGAVRQTGGWHSPFLSAIAVPVVVATATVGKYRALAIAFAAALVAASPALYTHGSTPLAVILLAAAGYSSLVLFLSRSSERDRAIDVSEKRARGLVTLQRVSAIVGGHLGTDDAIQAIVRELEDAFGHQLITVYLREGANLVLQAQSGYVQPFAVIPLGVGICGRSAATAKTAFIPFVLDDPGYRPAADDVVSEICVPLIDAGHVIGIVNVESRTLLTDLDRELLELFGGQVVVVLRNAQRATELRRRAEHDPVTGLLNHRAVMEALDIILRQPAARCAVLMMDLNCFKQFNDAHGHLIGDAILRQVAGILSDNCRQGDLAGRYGGDEFIVVLPDTTSEMAASVGRRIEAAVHACIYQGPGGHQIPLAISVGCAASPEDGESRQDLIEVADTAMYAAKRGPTSEACRAT